MAVNGIDNNRYIAVVMKASDSNILYSEMSKLLKEVYTMKLLDYTILALVIIGAVNWGLIGFFYVRFI